MEGVWSTLARLILPCLFSIPFAEVQHELLEVCTGGGVIPNSNRTTLAPCTGALGTECAYECSAGFIKIGRHVCQSYSTQGHIVINHTFFGGRCDHLCASSAAPCPSGMVPVRLNITENGQACLQTICKSPESALRDLARGGYEAFRHSRNPKTGMYTDAPDLLLPPEKQSWALTGIHNIGFGVMAEVIAIDLEFVTLREAQERVLQTLRTCTGFTPGFRLPRNPQGWLPVFINGAAEHNGRPDSFSTDSTALAMLGVMFASRYFEVNDPTSTATAEIRNMTKQLYDLVHWENLLCDNGQVTGRGRGIPWIMDNATGCKAYWLPDQDGFYQVNEMLTAVWLAYEKACGGQPAGQCSNKPIEQMWEAWQGRKYRPNHDYAGKSLLSLWPAFTVQLPYYLAHPFNSDPTWQALFRTQWQAETAYFKSGAYYAGDSGRYGLGAGPTEKWCSGTGYKSDLISNLTNAQACKMYSPYSTAGYLPAAPEIIKEQLLQLLAIGEASLPISGTNYSILWRKSLIDPQWSQGPHVTMVDFTAEFWGLSTIWLGAEYFRKYTNHFAAAPIIFI